MPAPIKPFTFELVLLYCASFAFGRIASGSLITQIYALNSLIQ